jgi:hypothetical protein
LKKFLPQTRLSIKAPNKGASYNEVSNNIAEDLGGNTSEATYAYRSQGLIRDTYDRRAVGNKFYNNKAINIHNTSSTSKT